MGTRFHDGRQATDDSIADQLSMACVGPLACVAPVSNVAQLSMMKVWHVLPTSSTCCHPSILVPGIYFSSYFGTKMLSEMGHRLSGEGTKSEVKVKATRGPRGEEGPKNPNLEAKAP